MRVNKISKLNFGKDEAVFLERPSNDSDVPIIHVHTTHAFNRIIGYARYINSSVGTVLYRGQVKQYKSLMPSGARENKVAVSDEIIDEIRRDDKLRSFFALNQPEIMGWKQYECSIVEATLQHYGANTFFMDFVDNHWCALWFGLNKFNHTHYAKRSDAGNMYIYLYVADTLGPCVRGMYIGGNTITVDLRKAVPSTFQRPASQHGWVVKRIGKSNQNLDENLIGIIEISVSDANEWLGAGTLLSEDNFFPSYADDQGYRILLQRQKRSGLPAKSKLFTKILPINTIQNYHFSELVYPSIGADSIKPTQKIPFISCDSEHTLADMLARFWESGWQQETCSPKDKWDESNPIIGQSAATALLVQRFFGGRIASFNYSGRVHYYNFINETPVDLTNGELTKGKDYYYEVSLLSKCQNERLMKKTSFANCLLNNCCLAAN